MAWNGLTHLKPILLSQGCQQINLLCKSIDSFIYNENICFECAKHIIQHFRRIPLRIILLLVGLVAPRPRYYQKCERHKFRHRIFKPHIITEIWITCSKSLLHSLKFSNNLWSAQVDITWGLENALVIIFLQILSIVWYLLLSTGNCRLISSELLHKIQNNEHKKKIKVTLKWSL